MTRWARYAYFASLVIFLAGLVFQVYLVGQSLFVNPGDWSVHVELGWNVAWGMPLLILFSAAFSRLSRRRWAVVVALLVAALIHPELAAARDTNPSLAALHPINALLILGLTLWLLQDAWRMIRIRVPATSIGGQAEGAETSL